MFVIQLRRIKQFYKQYERLLVPGVLLFGVVVDFVTFRTIQVQYAFLLLGAHWVVAGLTISFWIHSLQRVSERVSVMHRAMHVLSPLLIQFTFGALLSASFIFYWFSGSLSVSWPFMLVIAGLMVANETFREYYLRPFVQLGVYYFITFSLLTLVLPYLLNSISAWVYVAGGVMSLLIGLGYLSVLSDRFLLVYEMRGRLRAAVLGVFILMNVLYFTNVIPPIPLSLRDAGMYHSVARVGAVYQVEEERVGLLGRVLPGQVMQVQEGGSLAAFVSVFAPAELDTTIVHEWQYFDASKKGFVTKSELAYGLVGGRTEGYRGYSQTSVHEGGLWRVRVQTARGQTIGTIWFWASFVDDPVKTQLKIK